MGGDHGRPLLGGGGGDLGGRRDHRLVEGGGHGEADLVAEHPALESGSAARRLVVEGLGREEAEDLGVELVPIFAGEDGIAEPEAAGGGLDGGEAGGVEAQQGGEAGVDPGR